MIGSIWYCYFSVFITAIKSLSDSASTDNCYILSINFDGFFFFVISFQKLFDEGKLKFLAF